MPFEMIAPPQTPRLVPAMASTERAA